MKHDDLRYKKDKSYLRLSKRLKTKKSERDEIDKNCKFTILIILTTFYTIFFDWFVRSKLIKFDQF